LDKLQDPYFQKWHFLSVALHSVHSIGRTCKQFVTRVDSL